ncbi:putative L-lactate dehydrogenase, Fe-S oxidoreductase subunit YkgE [Thioalkalivibrio nitratireducens DSM 14787]|uniref:L-lactate dehydrogenase, Fe-S oxidoreductase subunit YkgE n=1 Tax=Thioalkalivibrio nitratireducens (strain DSM 14787 / UNIQEM 213 / ALEN2) TaxID=1255043 RepID=L0DU20_THIND|nr:(Fe-S)-binding protein [Thioalkalivibrio nitratireducens]AGA31856.1 putative L-lactate dehydrogenase, Fe-S oxidoreductase subunit YkgE [Thioalkalivibrio nitratireducens DSM 14787]
MSDARPESSDASSDGTPRIGLFVTCLADIYRPNVGLAAVALLERSGCTVEVPDSQTCCGQPSYNNGDLAGAARTARRTIEAFEDYDYVVVPSGSCAGMLRDYPRLFEAEPGWRLRARAMAEKTHELISFLTDVRGVTSVDAAFNRPVTYHDSCHGLRALGIKEQPRRLLESVRGLELREMADSEICCGFGGTFCVKYPEISGRMVADKAASIGATEAKVVLGGDLGCLLNIAGRLGREGGGVSVYHVAEVLAGIADVPGLGDPPKPGKGSR